MTVAGDSRDWDSFFQTDLIPVILAHVVSTWAPMEKPGRDALEEDVSLKLYSALINAKDRSAHQFLIRYEDVEVDTDLAKEIGRKDIVFYPSTLEEIYFCLEAKRLNALVSGRRTALADEYVKEGMLRFVSGKYSKQVRHGGMLGYVLDGQVGRAIKNIDKNIRARLTELGMASPGGLQPSSVRADDHCAKETHHRRPHEQALFRLHHLFLPCAAAAEGKAKKGSAPGKPPQPKEKKGKAT
jgi:hypothetical protein